MQHAAFGARAHERRNLIHRSWRIGEPFGGGCKAGGVAHGGRLDRGLRAVEERIEHFRIQAADLRLLGRKPVVAPHRLGRGLREVRQPFVPASGGHDRKARGACPVDQIADQRRLVAIGEAVDDAGLPRLAREQRSAERIRLDGHHHHVLAVLERRERVLDGGDWIPGRLDHDVDLGICKELAPVLRDRRALDQLRLPTYAREIRPCIVGREIGDAD